MPKPKPRRIAVTGATRGLGRALIRGFVEAGHRVYGCGRDAGTVRELRRLHGNSGDFRVVDVSDEGQVGRWADAVLKEGAPDILVNNAGLINRPAPLWEVPAGEFSDVIDVNVKGMANVIRRFVPAMVRRRKGVIVNLSSECGRVTLARMAPYCASKYAVEGLTKSLAQELPEGMAAVPLGPGAVNTDMLEKCCGPKAASYPSPDTWAAAAVPYILRLGPKHNGRSLTVRL
ncbi:MAG: SDR family oxidoreductase [Elusimicrobiota bacterium]